MKSSPWRVQQQPWRLSHLGCVRWPASWGRPCAPLGSCLSVRCDLCVCDVLGVRTALIESSQSPTSVLHDCYSYPRPAQLTLPAALIILLSPMERIHSSNYRAGPAAGRRHRVAAVLRRKPACRNSQASHRQLITPALLRRHLCIRRPGTPEHCSSCAAVTRRWAHGLAWRPGHHVAPSPANSPVHAHRRRQSRKVSIPQAGGPSKPANRAREAGTRRCTTGGSADHFQPSVSSNREGRNGRAGGGTLHRLRLPGQARRSTLTAQMSHELSEAPHPALAAAAAALPPLPQATDAARRRPALGRQQLIFAGVECYRVWRDEQLPVRALSAAGQRVCSAICCCCLQPIPPAAHPRLGAAASTRSSGAGAPPRCTRRA